MSTLQIKQQSEFLMHQIEEHTELVDLYFLHSYKKLQNQLKSQINQYILRFVLICILLPLNYYVFIQANDYSRETFNLFLCITFVQNIVQIARHLFFYHFQLKNTKNVMRIASSFNHCLSQDELRFIDQSVLYEIDAESQLRVSTVFYDFENREKNADVQQHYKAVRQKLGQNSIKSALEGQLCFYRSLGCLLDIISAGVLIYAAILCFRDQLTDTQNTWVQIYMLFEIMFKTKVFGILILLMLAPLILVFAVIYVCFCKRQEKANLPKAQKMTNAMIARCSDCAICFQNLEEKEEVIELPCSNMHIFHEGCIDKWAKVNPKCPICRHVLV